MKRTRLRPISPKRRKGYDEYRHMSALVQAREGSACARCRVHAPVGYGAPHHRRKASQGGANDATNLVWACHSCNAGWIEDNPTEATRLGWTVPHGVNVTVASTHPAAKARRIQVYYRTHVPVLTGSTGQ